MTTNEMRQAFLEHISCSVDYAERETRWPTVRDKLEGLAFSILVLLDGEAVALPGFYVVPVESSTEIHSPSVDDDILTGETHHEWLQLRKAKAEGRLEEL